MYVLVVRNKVFQKKGTGSTEYTKVLQVRQCLHSAMLRRLSKNASNFLGEQKNQVDFTFYVYISRHQLYFDLFSRSPCQSQNPVK